MKGQVEQDKRLHYHLLIGNCPAKWGLRSLDAAFREAARCTDFADREIHVAYAYDSGWVRYMTKEVGRNDTDCIDWENMALPKAVQKN